MSILIVGLVVFIAIHLLPSFATSRDQLIQKIGPGAYKGLFSVISLSGLVLIGFGKSQAEFRAVWQPQVWGVDVALCLMVIASILLVSAYTPSNVKRFTRHPMLWAVTLWSLAHLLANGDLASILMFGSLGLFSVFDMISANRRGANIQTEKKPFKNDLLTIVAGVAVFAALLYLHLSLFGVGAI